MPGPHRGGVEYARLAGFFERLEATSGRLGMTAILVEMLEAVPKDEMTCVVRLLQGAVAPDWEGLEVGLAEKQILKTLAAMAGGARGGEPAAAVQSLYHEKGDLGLAAEAVVAQKGAQRQASLFGAGGFGAAGPLSVPGVFAQVLAIANTGGTGSQEAKQRLLAQLLGAATPIEARYITRMVAGRLRLGVADMTFLDALAAWHLGRGVRSVQEMEEAERAEQEQARADLERAYDLRSDLAVVAQELARGGLPAVRRLGIQPGIPVRPMAAERLKTLGEILERMQGRVAMEYKYDGLRVQAHVPASPGQPVRLFSRRLEDMTVQFPDVGHALRSGFRGRDCIVEGEMVALDERGRLRPFQDVSRRRGRKADIAQTAEEIPVTLFLFDCLAEGGRSTMDLPYLERRGMLATWTAPGPADGGDIASSGARVRTSTMAEATTVEEMERFFDQAVEDGAEGIMCKDPQAPYKAGSRGFAWVKFKTDYTADLVDTMDLVAIGAFLGRGRRVGWYGALLMGAYDKAQGKWVSVCKLGTGFDDATLQSLRDRFAACVSAEKPATVESGLVPDVWFDPCLVLEVQAAELTLSPTHVAGWGRVKEDAGFAARFPRFTRWREDKSPEQATTVDELERMHALKKR